MFIVPFGGNGEHLEKLADEPLKQMRVEPWTAENCCATVLKNSTKGAKASRKRAKADNEQKESKNFTRITLSER